MMVCDGCGHKGDDVKSSLMFDLCPACERTLRAEHVTYAEAQRRCLSRDAGCPVLAEPPKVEPPKAAPARDIILD